MLAYNLHRRLHFNQEVDPTRTKTLRDRFAVEMRRRFNIITSLIRHAIVDKDVFGLSPVALITKRQAMERVQARQFAFATSAQKVDAFMDWLESMDKEFILSGGARGAQVIRLPGTLPGVREAWTDTYIHSAYQKGVLRARNEMVKAGYDVPSLAPGDTDALRIAFNLPIHADRVGLVATRAFSELKGITTTMEQQVARVLAQGMADGENPRRLARLLTKTITGPVGDLGITDTLGRFIPARRRAELLARTEIIRSHHVATINEYRHWEVEGVRVRAEWTTAGDHRVCSDCASLQGRVFKLEEIENMIPFHPLCRCIALPLEVREARRAPLEREKAGVIGAREKPMNVIGRMEACTPRIVTLMANSVPFVLQRPQACRDIVREEGKWYLQGELIEDEAMLKRLDSMRIPPGWRSVVVAKDPTQKIQAIGLDIAGRWQYRYSAEFVKEQAQKKFNRVKSFSRDMPAISRKIEDGIAQGHPEAYLMRLEEKTAIRIGTDKDFKARKKAYGLTTLLNEHVTVRGNKITLEFIAKEGKHAKYVLEDDVLAPWLQERKMMTREGEKLFADVPSTKLNRYLKKLADGKNYTVKDFRTYHGTRIARDELKKYAGKELTVTERKKIVSEVSRKVSEFLHNTPAMARNSYIDPMVWDYIGGIP